jgi:uncharacterized protein
MRKKIILAFFVFIIPVLIFFLFQKEKAGKVCFKNNCFIVEIAKTQKELTRGLMFRGSLQEDRGMLFIFQEDGNYPFWMKNTLIPLDIIWINEEKNIVFINKNTQPCKEEICPSVNPGAEARYVLELNGGIAEKIGLSVGDMATFK